ncbi:ComEC/Rec2 family competence protein [Patescibacteria group bacterium]|nr:ComEC/Rec2 family competence protein [Patescibacteria group bacterium]MDE1946830.1 ComEC/Rec2 family competence protein [Patescibacteria group bacterium]MDE2010650.1 ComEC/Rec2 family competence protein [Patescibacteria group bacterium]
MRKGITIFWSVFIAAAILRLAFSFYLTPPFIGSCLKREIIGTGIITTEPERKESGQILVISTDSIKPASTSTENISCGAGFQIRAKAKLYPLYSYGDRVEFSGKLSQPMNFGSGRGRAFDYRGYLAKDDIFYEIKSASVRKISNGGGMDSITMFVTSALYKVKRWFVGNLERSLGEPHAALAAGLVVGEKSALGKDLLADFRTVGLIHIVVLSGFNITVVADALRRLLSRLPRVWGIFAGAFGIILFGVMVGGGATVVRSCAMASVALFANLIRRDYNVPRALAFAALLMLIQNPMILLHDPSFQLSFLATLGLILLSGPIEKRIQFLPEVFGIRGTVAATFATQIFVSPYILYMMGQLSLIGVVVNILVLPLIPLTMLAVFLTGAAGFVLSPLGQLLGWFAHLLLSYELFMVEYFARLPFAAVFVPAFSFWWVVGFYTVFTIAWLFTRRSNLYCLSVSNEIDAGGRAEFSALRES